MELGEVTKRITEAVGVDSGLGKKLKFDFGDVGKIFIDGASSPNTVSNDDAAADCTIKLSWDDFLNMAQGKLKVEGDMSIAMKLQPILSKLR